MAHLLTMADIQAILQLHEQKVCPCQRLSRASQANLSQQDGSIRGLLVAAVARWMPQRRQASQGTGTARVQGVVLPREATNRLLVTTRFITTIVSFGTGSEEAASFITSRCLVNAQAGG
jgi:hypothetical protein